jgi:hypothetical protein
VAIEKRILGEPVEGVHNKRKGESLANNRSLIFFTASPQFLCRPVQSGSANDSKYHPKIRKSF